MARTKSKELKRTRNMGIKSTSTAAGKKQKKTKTTIRVPVTIEEEVLHGSPSSDSSTEEFEIDGILGFGVSKEGALKIAEKALVAKGNDIIPLEPKYLRALTQWAAPFKIEDSSYQYLTDFKKNGIETILLAWFNTILDDELKALNSAGKPDPPLSIGVSDDNIGKPIVGLPFSMSRRRELQQAWLEEYINTQGKPPNTKELLDRVIHDAVEELPEGREILSKHIGSEIILPILNGQISKEIFIQPPDGIARQEGFIEAAVQRLRQRARERRQSSGLPVVMSALPGSSREAAGSRHPELAPLLMGTNDPSEEPMAGPSDAPERSTARAKSDHNPMDSNLADAIVDQTSTMGHRQVATIVENMEAFLHSERNLDEFRSQLMKESSNTDQAGIQRNPTRMNEIQRNPTPPVRTNGADVEKMTDTQIIQPVEPVAVPMYSPEGAKRIEAPIEQPTQGTSSNDGHQSTSNELLSNPSSGTDHHELNACAGVDEEDLELLQQTLEVTIAKSYAGKRTTHETMDGREIKKRRANYFRAKKRKPKYRGLKSETTTAKKEETEKGARRPVPGSCSQSSSPRPITVPKLRHQFAPKSIPSPELERAASSPLRHSPSLSLLPPQWYTGAPLIKSRAEFPSRDQCIKSWRSIVQEV